MALSEKSPADMAKLRSGIIGVAILIVLGTLAPMIIYETTGVDLGDLCIDEDPNTDEDSPGLGITADCEEDNDIRETVLEALGYVSIVVAVVGFVMLIVIGIRY